MNRILVVDDSKVAQTLLAGILEKEYELDFQNNGPEGIAAARKSSPDLILLDIHMPIMDGIDVCRIFRQEEKTKAVPIIFITSLGSEEEKVRGFEAGADDYIVKPFFPMELLARVKAHLASHLAREQAVKLERLTVFKEMAVALNHEINNPLMSVYTYLHLLQRELAGSEGLVKELLDGINDEVWRIRDITERLATASAAESTNYTSDISMIDLHKIQ